MDLQEAITVYLTLNRSPHTHSQYRRILLRLEAFAGAGRDLASIETADLLKFFALLRPTLKASTETCYTIIVKTFFNWCVGMDYLRFSPAARIKLRPPDPPPSFSRAMPSDVIAGMYQQVKQKKHLWAIRDEAIVAFLDDTACRRSAVANLLMSQLDFERNIAYSLEKGGHEKPLEFTGHAARALQAWIAVRPRTKDEHVFINPHKGSGYGALKPNSISVIIRRLSAKSGGRAWGPHSLRHTVAQDMYEHGESHLTIRDRLNHKHVETSERHYLYQSRKTVRGAAERRNSRRSSQPASPSEKILYVNFSDEELASV